MTQIFLTTTGSFPNPGNWNPINTVECIAPGGAGGFSAIDNGKCGSGGGGGAYAKGTNLVPAFPAPYTVGSYTNFNSSSGSFVNSGSVVSAQGGAPAAGGPLGSPGLGGTNFYPTGFKGGNGGDGIQNVAPYYGGAGGGAGGPHGAGANGQAGGNGSGTSTGGSADGGTVTGGLVGVNGNSGTQFDATHGCGSGGGGGKSPAKAGDGGAYGGGGGGAYTDPSAGLIGVGGAGLIVLTYVPMLATLASTMVMS